MWIYSRLVTPTLFMMVTWLLKEVRELLWPETGQTFLNATSCSPWTWSRTILEYRCCHQKILTRGWSVVWGVVILRLVGSLHHLPDPPLTLLPCVAHTGAPTDQYSRPCQSGHLSGRTSCKYHHVSQVGGDTKTICMKYRNRHCWRILAKYWPVWLLY